MPIELLVDFDDILKKSRELLTEMGKVPADCPDKINCLNVLKTSNQPGLNNSTIIIEANPPKLPTGEAGRTHAIHPACRNRCGIEGNPFRVFRIVQQNETGKILEVDSSWAREV